MVKILFLCVCFQLVLYSVVGLRFAANNNNATQLSPCAAMLCMQNTTCVEEPTNDCATPPCPPRGNCTPISNSTNSSSDMNPNSGSCKDVKCAEGEVCKEIVVNCIRAPCPGMTKCIKRPSTITCANVRCAGGPCVMEKSCDSSGSCTERPVCKPSTQQNS